MYKDYKGKKSKEKYCAHKLNLMAGSEIEIFNYIILKTSPDPS